jgi:hypothetical protein
VTVVTVGFGAGVDGVCVDGVCVEGCCVVGCCVVGDMVGCCARIVMPVANT